MNWEEYNKQGEELSAQLSGLIAEHLNNVENEKQRLFLQRVKERVGLNLKPEELILYKDNFQVYIKHDDDYDSEHVFYYPGQIHIISFFKSKPEYNFNPIDPNKIFAGFELKYS